MRVAMMLSNDCGSDPRVEKEARVLTAAGHEVVILAWDRAGELPSAEDRDGFRIERFGPRARHGAGVRNLGLYREFWRSAAARAVDLHAEVLHCHDLDTAPAGVSASRSLRAKLVLDFHELYRESNMVPQRGGVGVVARAAVRLVERWAIPKADLVVVANPGTLPYYERFGVRDRTVLVENAPELARFAPGPSHSEAPFTVGFMGQKRYLPPLETLIAVVRHLPGTRALLAGGGVAEARVDELAAGAENVEVSGRFRYDELPAMYARCDAVYAVYDAPNGNVRTLFPVKAMEAMACALPVIVAEGTWVGDYVTENGLGIAVPPAQPAPLRAALERLRDHPDEAAAMGRRGRGIVEGGLNWEAAASRLSSAYASLR